MDNAKNISTSPAATGTGPIVRQGLLSAEQLARLAEPIPPEFIRARQVGGGALRNYTIKEYLTQELQNIFGIENVSIETLDMTKVSEAQIQMKEGSSYVPGIISCWTCKRRITVRIPRDGKPDAVIVREGTGTCASQFKTGEMNTAASDAAELAIKGAETDALKRAAATFGPRLGNDIENQEGEPVVLTASQQRLKSPTAAPTGIPAGRPSVAGNAAKLAAQAASAKASTTTPDATPAAPEAVSVVPVAPTSVTSSTAPNEDSKGMPEDVSEIDEWDKGDPFGTESAAKAAADAEAAAQALAAAEAAKAAAATAVDYTTQDRDAWIQTFKTNAELCEGPSSGEAELLTALTNLEAMQKTIGSMPKETILARKLKQWHGDVLGRVEKNLGRVPDAGARQLAAARITAARLR